MLTDEQCNEFRSLPVSFNDMVRAIHADGYAQALKDAAAACERVGDEYTERERFKCLEMRSDAETGAASCAAAILALGKEKP
jgi:hypothetical protein